MLKRLCNEDEGVLTFEWIVLLTFLVVGIVGGVAGIRDAINHEAQGTVGAMLSVDQSYQVASPLSVSVSSYQGTGCATSTASYAGFGDVAIWSDGRPTTGSLSGYSQVSGHLTNLCPIQ